MLFFLTRWVLRTSEGSLLIPLGFWVMFWTFENVYSVIINFSNTLDRVLLLTFIIAGLIFAIIFFHRYNPPFAKIGLAFIILSMYIVMLFIFNFSQVINHEITLTRARRYSEENLLIKRDFNINYDLPKPNIYWLHMDEMISLNSFERFFGTSQDSLREELNRRGFVINEDAILGSGSSCLALASLLLPAFYDSGYGEILDEAPIFDEAGNMQLFERIGIINSRLAHNGFNLVENVAPYAELIQSLSLAGYETTNIAINHGVIGSTPFDRFYDIFSVTEHPLQLRMPLSGWNYMLFQSGDLPQLLRLSSFLSVIPERLFNITNTSQWPHVGWHTYEVDRWLTSFVSNTVDEEQIYRMLIDTRVNSFNPRFTLVTVLLAHVTHWPIHNPNVSRRVNYWELGDTYERLYLYELAYEYAAAVMLNSIDMILENDPNAIIVIQSDHGIKAGQILLDLGFSHEEALELYISVLGAVRIPPQYGGLDAPLAPLNISRELVNRFVGLNYELLPD